MPTNYSKIIPIIAIKDPPKEEKLLDLEQLNQEFHNPILPEPKDITMVKAMLAQAEPRKINNNTVAKSYEITKKTHLALVLMPKWAVYFAPYNLARLAAVTRTAGYKTSLLDYNVETWHRVKDLMDEDPYTGHGSRDFLWLGETYNKRLKEHVEPILEEYLQQLIELNPTVIGFSLYYTNLLPTRWMAKKIKEHLPNTKIIVGGSHLQWESCKFDEFDHTVKGEAEELLLELLDKIENNIPLTQYQYEADTSKRLDLDALPFPDYSGIDLDKYMIPNAISSEISRGCVAKCVFCAETLFWKYRSRASLRILDEVEEQYKTYGTNMFWFIDSLVNGNIKELREFAQGVVDRGLNIKWKGYARCDDRMDLEYLTLLRNSGCDDLNYGIESGSQPVLDAMKKNTKVAIIERNLKDGASVGITNTTNWMLGFINETSNDFAHTMTLSWRMQNVIVSMARQTMNIGTSRVNNDPDKYNVHKKYFMGEWANKDLSNTKMHRLIRLKSFNIFIEQMPIYSSVDQDHNKRLTDSYGFTVDFDKKLTKENITDYLNIPYEDFDYNIIQDSCLDSIFSQTVVNEIWPLFRTSWRSRNKTALKLVVNFDPSWDINHYGENLVTNNFSASYNFQIDNHGNWEASACVIFDCPENPYVPWAAEDDYTKFSFNLNWNGSGHWD